MTKEGRTAIFIDSMETCDSPLLDEIEREARGLKVPVIHKQTQSLIKVLLTMQKPARILEVGTATGFSALLMSEYAPKGAHVTTIENYKKNIDAALKNFKRAGRENEITLLEGDAIEVLKALEGSYDFIFMDAAKGQYIRYLPEILRLLAPDGILVSDNVLKGGEIIESRYAVERRNRTIHARLREYLYEIKHNKELVTAIVPSGDGVSISVKNVLKGELYGNE